MGNRWLRVSEREPLDREIVLFSWGLNGDGRVGYIARLKDTTGFLIIDDSYCDGEDPVWFLRLPKLPDPPV